VDGDDQNGESSSSDAEEEDGAEELGEEEDAMHENEIEEAAWEGEGGAADDDTQSHATAHESLPLESMPPAPACQGTQQEPLVVLVSEEVRREEVELAIAAMGSLALLVAPPNALSPTAFCKLFFNYLQHQNVLAML
jgi:hypothetical protein